jgi:transposase InsO family protein
MPRIKYTVEHIITKLREAEVALSKGQTVVQVSRSLGITEQLRDELLNGEIFETRWEATVLIERWRRAYNQIRPHSALGYQPPAPEAREPRDVQCA